MHLKDLVDTYKNVKFIATGSAAAALKLKSQESGAGRFSDFMLPPLTRILPAPGNHLESPLKSRESRATAAGIRYARWRNEGEVDIVFFSGQGQSPSWIGEIKWSDRVAKHFGPETRSMSVLLKKHPRIGSAFITTKSFEASYHLEGKPLGVTPSALYCYTVGRNITRALTAPVEVLLDESDEAA